MNGSSPKGCGEEPREAAVVEVPGRLPLEEEKLSPVVFLVVTVAARVPSFSTIAAVRSMISMPVAPFSDVAGCRMVIARINISTTPAWIVMPATLDNKSAVTSFSAWNEVAANNAAVIVNDRLIDHAVHGLDGEGVHEPPRTERLIENTSDVIRLVAWAVVDVNMTWNGKVD